MSEPAFALNLGNGLYIDSGGNLHQGDPKVPTYPAPFTLPVDPKKVSDALSSVKSALEDINKRGFLHDRWGKVDVVDKLLDLLAGIGKLAAALSPLAGAFSVAIDLGKLLGLFKDAPTQLENLVNERFNTLSAEVAAGVQIMHLDVLGQQKNDIGTLLSTVGDNVDNLKNNNPDPAQLETDRTRLENTYSSQINGFAMLFDLNMWLAIFQRRDHTLVWPLIADILCTFPGLPATPDAPDVVSTVPGFVVPPPTSAPADFLATAIPPDGSARFDHRLMVPLVSYAAESFLTCMRGIDPEYRTTGYHRHDLRRFAPMIDALAQAMRTHVLARTVYRPDHFSRELQPRWGDVVVSSPQTVTISPKCSFWPVGAMDLCYHDDAHFRDFLGTLTTAEFAGVTNPQTKLDLMNVRWIPPAVLSLLPKRDDGIVSEEDAYVITNPEECAAAANAQAELDYVDLLATSGYFELVRLAALFRNEATEPSTSQTVQPQTPTLYRNPLPSSSVTVQSNPVHFTGQIITSPALREPQDCRDKVEVWTQPIKRARPVQYRVRLRTLNSFESKDEWRDVAYSDYQRVDYEPDPDNPGFLRLVLSNAFLEVANKPIIPDWMPSPANEPKRATGAVDMLADTFDWWIPVASPYSIYKPFHETQAALHAAGWFDQKTATPAPAGYFWESVIPQLFWKPSKGDWDGQRRDIRKEEVHIEYELEWIADRLHFSIRNRPSDRNYIVYLVIEEKMQASPNILDTAVALPVNGLLTYVPAKFFEDEFAAHAQTASVIAGLIGKYIPSAPGPIDPIIGWVRPGDLATRAGVNRFLDIAKESQPALFQSILEEVNAGRRVATSPAATSKARAGRRARGNRAR